MERCSGRRCHCSRPHRTRTIVLTGGPGAGKTAVLEMVRRSFCEHVVVVQEAAGLVFGGGFPRTPDPAGRDSAQRAIYYVQRELERYAHEVLAPSVIVCDRGTIDSVAYSRDPGFLRTVGSDLASEVARYDAVIHLHSPSRALGYENHSNPVRIETPEEAAIRDAEILAAWSTHPARVEIDSSPDFVAKALRALAAIREVVPACCLDHDLQALVAFHTG